jgi:hypothetical protein
MPVFTVDEDVAFDGPTVGVVVAERFETADLPVDITATVVRAEEG